MRRSKQVVAIMLMAVIAIGMTGYLQVLHEDRASMTLNNEYNKSMRRGTTIYEKILEFKDRIEPGFGRYVGFRSSFVELNGFIQKILGKRIIKNEMETIVKLNNGQLDALYESSQVVEQNADKLVQLYRRIEDEDTKAIFLLAPSKTCRYDDALPDGLTTYVNENADAFLAVLEKNNMDYIDFREELHKEGLNHYDLFFCTDHHWKPETALWAAQKTANKLNESYGYNMDESLLNINSFNIDIYSNWFLGEWGRRVGLSYCGVEDISLIYPRFKTSLTYFVADTGLYKTGTFYESVLDISRIEKCDYYDDSPYAAYMGGAAAYRYIENNLAGDYKVLLICDSFGLAYAPFLSLVCQKLEILDVREYSEMPIKSYVEKSNPDLVMTLYFPPSCENEDCFYF